MTRRLVTAESIQYVSIVSKSSFWRCCWVHGCIGAKGSQKRHPDGQAEGIVGDSRFSEVMIDGRTNELY